MHPSLPVPNGLAAEWDSALDRLAGGSFYHRYAWRAINEETLGHRSEYLAVREDDRIAGLLPLTLVSSRMFGRILCSMPFVNYGGPCSDDASISLELTERARAVARDNGVNYLEMRCSRPIDCGLPVSMRKISMVVPLASDPERIWASFSGGHRTSIRRAEQKGLVVESGGRELLSDFYRVMEESWRAFGTPLYARDYFEHILASFPDDTRIFVCRRQGKAIATAINGYFGGTAEGMWNGSVAEARGLNANYVLYWHMIRDACVRGFARFHLGRSTADSGGEEFKRKWRAEKHQLYWYYWRPDGREIPALNVDNPKYRLAIAAWRRLPLAVTRVVGPHVARCIP